MEDRSDNLLILKEEVKKKFARLQNQKFINQLKDLRDALENINPLHTRIKRINDFIKFLNPGMKEDQEFTYYEHISVYLDMIEESSARWNSELKQQEPLLANASTAHENYEELLKILGYKHNEFPQMFSFKKEGEVLDTKLSMKEKLGIDKYITLILRSSFAKLFIENKLKRKPNDDELPHHSKKQKLNPK